MRYPPANSAMSNSVFEMPWWTKAVVVVSAIARVLPNVNRPRWTVAVVGRRR
ncbi:hypothetical protein [Lentzea albidocapillata]|uniref:Uncharacterized protein n=1 Tax=Lentzea albidocapillata TaxID=40571 RepID=A0A1W2FRW2_9PSEU|nr:hypothetical protein [Lentzea albidocapillata]SMD24665.1 hypothetical protein SAMN05660733_07786 [Lentzea albidocapillata]